MSTQCPGSQESKQCFLRGADVWKEAASWEPHPNLQDGFFVLFCFLNWKFLAGNRHGTSTGLQPTFVGGQLGIRYNSRWPKIWDTKYPTLLSQATFFPSPLTCS